jgi:hypothetical protein
VSLQVPRARQNADDLAGKKCNGEAPTAIDSSQLKHRLHCQPVLLIVQAVRKSAKVQVTMRLEPIMPATFMSSMTTATIFIQMINVDCRLDINMKNLDSILA